MDKRKMIFPILAAGILSLAVALGALTYRTVNAQGTTPTPGTPADEAPAFPERGMKLRGAWGATQQDLADALGVELADLQAAQQAATEKALDEAVSQGLITQAQADQMKARGLGGRMLGGPWVKDGTIDYQALLAAELGVSVETLETARQTAAEAALTRAVDAGTITQEQADLIKGRSALANDENFQSSMQSAFESAVAKAVSDGVITQAQADAILQNSTGKWFGGRGGFEGPHGFGGRHGRGGRGFPLAPDAEPAAPDTSAAPEGGL